MMSDFSYQRVLVTGATGFLGGALTRRLCSIGVQVRTLARRPDDTLRELPGVEVVLGDLTDSHSLDRIAADCDIVFHCAAALGGPAVHQHQVNVVGTRNLLNVCIGVRRVVHVSSIAVYGYRQCSDVTEEAPHDPGADPYNISKSQAEVVVRESGIPYSIIRPGMIYGPRGGLWTVTAFKLARRNPTVFLGDGSGSAYPVHVDDVVDLMLVLADHPAAEGEAFHCTPDPSPTFREYLSAFSDHEHWLSVPVAPVALMVRVLRPFAGNQHRLQDLPDILDMLQTYRTYRMDKARDRLGWEPRIDLETGVQTCMPYLREKGLL